MMQSAGTVAVASTGSSLQKAAEPAIPPVPFVSIHRIQADGVNVFYREAGPADAPVMLLLHGFPTSSFQYRELMPLLADKYHVIAPDLPCFGFTEVFAERNYNYTFDNLAKTILAFTNALKLTRYASFGTKVREAEFALLEEACARGGDASGTTMRNKTCDGTDCRSQA